MIHYPKFKILHFTLIPIGITSFYFHSTLSLSGQLLDEFSIILSIVVSVNFMNGYYQFYNNDILHCINFFQILFIFILPDFNRICLFIYGFMAMKLIVNHVKLNREIEISRRLFIFSVFLWIVDYICYFHLYLHSFWHISIGLTSLYLFIGLEKSCVDLLVDF